MASGSVGSSPCSFAWTASGPPTRHPQEHPKAGIWLCLSCLIPSAKFTGRDHSPPPPDPLCQECPAGLWYPFGCLRLPLCPALPHSHQGQGGQRASSVSCSLAGSSGDPALNSEGSSGVGGGGIQNGPSQPLMDEEGSLASTFFE